MLSFKDTAIALKERLERLLGDSGLNCLGQYQLFSGKPALHTVPAIQILYELNNNDVERKIIPNSGIECVINPNADSIYKPMTARQRDVCNYFTIVLIQHNPVQLLDSAVNLIMSDPMLNITESVDYLPATKRPDGVDYIPPRAILTHLQSYAMQPLF